MRVKNGNELYSAVAEITREIIDEKQLNANEIVLNTTSDVVNALRSVHVAGSEEWGPWDEYNKGWERTVDVKLGAIKGIAHNRTHYRLTHLLENGHLKRGGKDRTRSFPHIAPIADKYEASFVEKMEKL